MQDMLVQLDISFDQRPSYTLVAWLRHRDSQVAIGEPLAIIQDGETRKVISAPCSGRIVAIYADAGAPLLPRSVIALIRPGLPLVLPANELNGILVAIALIAVAVIIIPTLNGIGNQTSPTTTTDATSNTASWWPFGRTPQPSNNVAQATETPASDITPAANETPASDITPAANETPASDITPAPQATPEVGPPPITAEPLIKRISSLINEMIFLTNEIKPWIQTKQPINPQIYEQMIRPRISRNQVIVDQLHAIVSDNMPNQIATELEKQLISQLDQFINPCMAIYQAVQTANDNTTVPPDLSEQYGQCNNGSSNLVQYLGGQ